MSRWPGSIYISVSVVFCAGGRAEFFSIPEHRIIFLGGMVIRGSLHSRAYVSKGIAGVEWIPVHILHMLHTKTWELGIYIRES